MADPTNNSNNSAAAPPEGLDDFIAGNDQPSPLPPDAADTAPQGLNDFIAPELTAAQYGTPGQQALAGLEAAGQGIAGPLAPLAEEAVGVSPEAIKGRAEANPITHGIGQIGGLAGSLFTGVGEGALAAKAGELAAEASGLGKIGSTFIKGVIENSIVQGMDEGSRYVYNDPSSAESAVADIGLAGILGGTLSSTFGAISPLWKSTMSNKVGGLLKSVTDRLGGSSAVPDAINDAIQVSGVDVAPDVAAGMAKDPEIRQMFQQLQQSATSSGLESQQNLKDFKISTGNAIVNALGRTPEDVAGLTDVSDYEIGNQVKKSLINQIKATTDPISSLFEKVKERYKGLELPDETKANIANQVGQISQQEGYNLSPSSPQAKVVQRVLQEIPNLNSLEDLRKYSSVISGDTQSPDLWRVGGLLRKTFRSIEDGIIDSKLTEEAGANAMAAEGQAQVPSQERVTGPAAAEAAQPITTPDLISQHQAARAAYKSAMDGIDSLNDRLHVGRYNGPGSFVSALNDMAPEDVLRRLSPKGDAGIIGELSQSYPQAAKQIQNYHLDQLLKSSASRAAQDEAINPKILFNNLSKMSPEMRNFIIPNGAKPKLDAVKTILDALPDRMNTSGTAKTLDALWSKIPGSALGLATMLAGENPVTAILVGGLTKALGRDIPDATRLALLKFLGSNEKLDSEGFKMMADMLNSGLKGDMLSSRAVKNVFDATKEVLPQALMPSIQDRDKLDKALKSIQKDPQHVVNVGGKTGYYMPNHAGALGQVAGNAVTLLNSLRPNATKAAPLDSDVKPSAAAQSTYHNALDVAQQPLTVLHKLQQGNLTPQDVKVMQTIYPNLYNRLQQKMTAEVAKIAAKGQPIPYQLRTNLSLFLGQPMDSTITPASIMAAQPLPPAQMPQGGAPGNHPKRSTTALNKLSGAYRTPSQAAEAGRASKD